MNMKTKRNKTELSDFQFEPKSHGCYKVTYTSPVTHKTWSAIIDDMTIIDATKNAFEPKRRDLDILKSIVKNG